MTLLFSQLTNNGNNTAVHVPRTPMAKKTQWRGTHRFYNKAVLREKEREITSSKERGKILLFQRQDHESKRKPQQANVED